MARRILAFVFFLPIAISAAQTASEESGPIAKTPQFAIRMQLLKDFNESRECIVVLPGGHYRLESTTLRRDYTKHVNALSDCQATQSYAYEGTLTAEELRSLGAILERPEFRSLRKPERLPMSREFLNAWVLREREAPQTFFVAVNEDIEKKDLVLKPVFEWWFSLQKQKSTLKKRAEANECSLPSRISFHVE